MNKDSHDSLAKDKQKDKSHYYNDGEFDRALPSNNILPEPEDPFLKPFSLKEYL